MGDALAREAAQEEGEGGRKGARLGRGPDAATTRRRRGRADR
jgi:hypothetical protein